MNNQQEQQFNPIERLYSSPSIFLQEYGRPTLFEKSVRKERPILNFFLSVRMSICTFNSIIFFILVLFCTITFAFSVRDSFQIVEKKHSEDYAKQTIKAIRDEFFNLNDKIANYALWDLTYEMIHLTDPREQVSLFFQTFYSCYFMNKMQLNYIAMYLPNGTLLHYKSCWKLDEINGIIDELIHLDSFYKKNWNNSSTRINSIILPKQSLNTKTFQLEKDENENSKNHDNLSFEEILLISGTPIQTLDTKQSDGLLIYGRYMEKGVLNELALRTGHCFTVYNMDDLQDLPQLKVDLDLGNMEGKNDSQILFDYLENVNFHNIESTLNNISSFFDQCSFESESFRTRISQISQNQDRTCPYYVNNGTESSNSATRNVNFHLFRDFKGKAVMVLRIDDEIRNEPIVIGGTMSILTFFSILATIMSFTLQAIFEIGFIRRISSIQKTIKDVTLNNNPTLRIPPPKYEFHEKDEVGHLESNLNDMLRVLEMAQQKLAKDNLMMKTILERISIEGEKCKAVMNSIHDFVFIVESGSGKLISSNEAFEKRVSNLPPNEVILVNQLIRNERDFTSLEESLITLEYLSENPNCERYLAILITNPLSSSETEQIQDETTRIRNDIRSKNNIPITISVVKSRIVLSKDSIGDAFIILAKPLF